MLNKTLKIFVYDRNGKQISQNDYSEFIKVLLDIIDHNIQFEEDQYNMIHGFEFPPVGLKWNSENREWEKEDTHQILINRQLNNFIKSFGA